MYNFKRNERKSISNRKRSDSKYPGLAVWGWNKNFAIGGVRGNWWYDRQRDLHFYKIKNKEMEAVKEFIAHINIVVLVLVLLGGLFAKNYMSNVNLPVAIKTLVMGTLFVLVWIGILVLTGQFAKEDLADYFITYCAGTSLYELLLKYAIDTILKKLGQNN